MRRVALISSLALLHLAVHGALLTATIATPPPAQSGYFKLGATRNPAGREISIDSRGLLLDGRPWFPVMGEMHYTRVPEAEWRQELLKMKAGGLDVVSTYVFWIHHEEIPGQWDWSGRRDLHRFVQTCGQVGLKVLVRCGPWCHGEVRNGGFPDWVRAHKDWKLRSTDPHFLAAVAGLYGQIAHQLRGELWKDGGPVIGIQLDNEYGGSPDYLMALKKIAIQSGLDVPFYTKTGWPALRRPVPLGELLPFFGGYPDGFWQRSLVPMEGESWENYSFKPVRTDTGIGNDTLKDSTSGDTVGTEKYPYLTCETGGGMETSYHRRINLDPRDVESVALCQLGGGSSLMGYYMYHGGQNPEGKLSTLQESQATGYPNDLPVKNYDFNAPLGEYGQINPQYHWLRRLHLFLHDFGGGLSRMPATLPDMRPTNKTDVATLRWAVRSDGGSGYIFVNNYQRLQSMPPKREVQFKLRLPDGELLVPARPVTIPADEFFFWPFKLDLGGAKLIYATAQPVCRIGKGRTRVVFFAKTPGVPAEFEFDAVDGAFEAPSGEISRAGGTVLVRNVAPSRRVAVRIQTKSGDQVRVVLLNAADSLALWKGEWQGMERVFLTRAGLILDGSKLRLSSPQPEQWVADIFPAPPSVHADGVRVSRSPDGVFERYRAARPKPAPARVELSKIRPAGPAREIPLSQKWRLALAPTEADWTNAAVWKIKLPADLDLRDNPILRVHYVGDAARITLNGRLLDDDFYSGRPFDLGLKRYAPDILRGDLRLEILPLRKDAPVFIEKKARPDFGPRRSLAGVQSAQIVNRYHVVLQP